MRKQARKRRRAKLSPSERQRVRAERQFKNNIRTVFVNSGFEHIPTRDTTLEVGGAKGDIDALFLHENVLAIVEDTTLSSSSIGDHLRKKAEFFGRLSAAQPDLFQVLRSTFPRFDEYLRENRKYDVAEYVVRFVYCSRNTVDESYRTRYEPAVTVLSFSHLQYFLNLSKTIKRSCKYELLKFLAVELTDLGPVRSGSDTTSYRALLLPEIPSGFPEGHKLVSFLVDPGTLLERAYVLRADSWRDQEALYQRLLVRGKIASMRSYLVSEKRVFVNNIIVTLPNDTEYRTEDDRPLRSATAAITPVKLVIPKRFNAIGIIDGQHRVFAYHEGDDKYEREIAVFRERQHLLVTGIVYPSSISAAQAAEFEAKLFLEINDKQKRVRGDLKQAIERIVHPYSAVAVAKSVIERMAATGPLAEFLQVHFFDTGKIKTASIVSYGLRHIVALNAEVSLFREWPGPNKQAVRAKRNKSALNEYIQYSATQLNLLVAGFKAAIPSELWTTNLKESRALTTTTINGLIFCMRLLLENGELRDSMASYRSAFTRTNIDFRPEGFEYRSSHWRDLGRRLYDECFAR